MMMSISSRSFLIIEVCSVIILLCFREFFSFNRQYADFMISYVTGASLSGEITTSNTTKLNATNGTTSNTTTTTNSSSIFNNRTDDDQDHQRQRQYQYHQHQEQGISILIAVVTSRDNFSTRAKTIMNTWAKQILPNRSGGVGVTIRFFVGAAPTTAAPAEAEPITNTNSTAANSTTTNITSRISGISLQDDIVSLAKLADITDLSQIVVMSSVVDNEYPPVWKNTKMMQYIEGICSSDGPAGNPSQCSWILKVDDDAYVHLGGLLGFLQNRQQQPGGLNPTTTYAVYGEQGHGRPQDRSYLKRGGMKGPFCMGGSGYVLSRATLQALSKSMSSCVQSIDQLPNKIMKSHLWHSDVVIGLCIQQSTQQSCWSPSVTPNLTNDAEYRKYPAIFRHCYSKTLGSKFLTDKELQTVAVMHPYKDSKTMMELHDRFQKVVYNKTTLEM